METGDRDVLFLFDTTHAAMEAEEAIIDAGFWCDIVPRPPEAKTTLCGLAIEVRAADSADIGRLLEEEGIRYDLFQPEERQT